MQLDIAVGSYKQAFNDYRMCYIDYLNALSISDDGTMLITNAATDAATFDRILDKVKTTAARLDSAAINMREAQKDYAMYLKREEAKQELYETYDIEEAKE